MKKKTIIRLAVAVGLVGLAACGGSESSETSTVRTKNAALATNVQKYVGTATSEEWEQYRTETDFTNAAFRTGDKFTVGFDVNLDAVDANPLAPSVTPLTYRYNCDTYMQEDEGECSNNWNDYSLETDYRSAFSNLTLSSNAGNVGTEDLTQIKWAKCPAEVTFWPEWPGEDSPATSKASGFMVTFVQAPNDSFLTADCGPLPPKKEMDWYRNWDDKNLYEADGTEVRATGARMTLSYWKQWTEEGNTLLTLPDTAQPALKELLPTGLDGLSADKTIQQWSSFQEEEEKSWSWTDQNGEVRTYTYHEGHSMNIDGLSSKRVKDYVPFGLVASADQTGITVDWNRSADLESEDAVTHVLEMSTDGFENDIVTTHFTTSEASYSSGQPSCSINPKNKVAADTVYSFRVSALDQDGVQTEATDVATVTKSAENITCPTGVLAAPTAVVAKYTVKDYEYSVSWTAPADAADSAITYCIESSADLFKTEDQITQECGITATDAKIPFNGANPRTFRVVAARDNGVVSAPSAVLDVKLPEAKPVTNVKTSLIEDGVKISWTPGAHADGYTAQDTSVTWGFMGEDERGPQAGFGSVWGTKVFVISSTDLTEAFIPGAKIWIDVRGCNEISCATETSTIFANPEEPVLASEQEVITTTTAAPAGGDATTTAILDQNATEIKLPTGEFNLNITFTNISSGFGVRKQDIKSVEYQTNGGKWTQVADGKAVNISKDADKLGLRVTKTNGEVVESTKAIVRTAESADTTMAPEDSTETETTVASESSDSSSGNNIIVFAVIAVVLAGCAAVFAQKKKSSTKN